MASFLKRLTQSLWGPPAPAPSLPVTTEPVPTELTPAQRMHQVAAESLRSVDAPAYVRHQARADAEALLALGETGLARSLLVDALAVEPVSALRELLARVLLQRGETHLAQPLLEALAQDPRHAAAAELQLGQLAEDAGDARSARRHYERALALRPADPLARERARRLRAREEGEAGLPRQAWAAMSRMWGEAAAAGRYSVVEEIGRGGAATLFRARELGTSREVALKLLHPRGDPALRRQRLVREAALAARFTSELVVPILEVVPERDLMVMPYLHEGSLRMRLAQRALPPREAFHLVAELAWALALLHAGGVAHLDVKPSNVLLRRGRPVLADFGAASARELGQAAGTRPYMAPEAMVQPADHRADLYALGVVLVECLTGTPSADARPLTTTGNASSQAAAQLVKRLCHPDPEQRLGDARTAAQLFAALAAST
ncbi:MAG: protein kinase [Myxococcota bacterium]